MKKNIKYIFAAVAGFWLTGCTDELDRYPLSSLSPERECFGKRIDPGATIGRELFGVDVFAFECRPSGQIVTAEIDAYAVDPGFPGEVGRKGISDSEVFQTAVCGILQIAVVYFCQVAVSLSGIAS